MTFYILIYRLNLLTNKQYSNKPTQHYRNSILLYIYIYFFLHTAHPPIYIPERSKNKITELSKKNNPKYKIDLLLCVTKFSNRRKLYSSCFYCNLINHRKLANFTIIFVCCQNFLLLLLFIYFYNNYGCRMLHNNTSHYQPTH